MKHVALILQIIIFLSLNNLVFANEMIPVSGSIFVLDVVGDGCYLYAVRNNAASSGIQDLYRDGGARLANKAPCGKIEKHYRTSAKGDSIKEITQSGKITVYKWDGNKGLIITNSD